MQSTSRIPPKICAARAARLFMLIEPMISLFCAVVVQRRRPRKRQKTMISLVKRA